MIGIKESSSIKWGRTTLTTFRIDLPWLPDNLGAALADKAA